jgi:superfamily II DNA or RNA helicase
VSFVPLHGPASFERRIPLRDSEVVFTDGDARVVRLPMRGAIPVLTRAHRREDVHPSVRLLSGAALMAIRFVAESRLEPDESGDAWRIGALAEADRQRVTMLAQARAYDGLDAEAAEELVRYLLDAVADAMPRATPRQARSAPVPAARRNRTDTGIGTRTGTGHIHVVTLSLRVEADDEDLLDGRVRLVLQVHDADEHSTVVDAARLWSDTDHDFSGRARLHTTTLLRAAATCWAPLDRLLSLRVPDEIVLDGDEVTSLLETGIEALAARGVDVLWPRALRRDLTAEVVLEHRGTQPQEEPLVEGLFGPQAMFSFDWRVALGADPLTAEEMDRLAEATTPIIRLRDNWMVVDPALARRARRRLSRAAKPAEAVAAVLTGVATVDGEDVVVHAGRSLERLRAKITSAATREPIAAPAGLRATLRDYQRHGVTWLAELTSLGLGACLADDMGLGKTVTLIALHLHRRETQALSGPTLVVCPASLLGNWEAELRRFAPGVDVRRFHGTERSLDGVGDGFVLTTYGTMRRDHRTLAAVGWDLVVADEAQHIKNPASSTARNLRTISSRARVALTGTPVENNLTELWAILDWATPGLLGSRNAFRKVWAGPIESGLEPSKARQFADLVGPFLLRRRKSDPGIAPELPSKTETDHLVGLTREQVVLYEALVRESMDRITHADEHARRGLVLSLLTGLKQICNHPAHYLKQTNPRLTGRSDKLDLLDELLATILAEGGAVLVFTQYVAMARLLERHLAASGIATSFLHGGTPVRGRERMVAGFQAGEVPVFLLSLKAGGTGLNLTRADHVVHFDRWWNPAVEEQATDRAYRIGQTRPVQVHKLVTEGTIEQKVAELLTRKRALADSVLAAGETALTELDDADLRDLVTLRGH